ncbi:hypothetical protein ACHAWF_014098 [Thalassiosira exigua]
MFVDSYHAGDKKTRRSRTGFMIFANQGLVQWFSKKQPTVETSMFGAEFVAMKNGMECLRGIRYKLCMMGVPVDYPSYIFGDNMSVIHNTQRPESVLKKKSNSICYHAVREAVTMGECLTGPYSRSHLHPLQLCGPAHESALGGEDAQVGWVGCCMIFMTGIRPHIQATLEGTE